MEHVPSLKRKEEIAVKFKSEELNKYWKDIFKITSGTEDTDDGLYIHFFNGRSISILDVQRWLEEAADKYIDNEEKFIMDKVKVVAGIDNELFDDEIKSSIK